MSKGFIDITTGVQYESKGDYARKNAMSTRIVYEKIKSGALQIEYIDDKK